jgi:hypothetical protein
MNFMPKKCLIILGIVILAFMLGSCKEESAQGSQETVELDYSPLSAANTQSKALLTENLLALLPGDIQLLEFRTYLEETEFYLEEKKAQTQEEIEDVLKWLNILSERVKQWEPTEIPPPWPLVECGNAVIAAPEGIDKFYAKYTNAYDGDFTQGIPIVAIADIPDEYILKMREVVNMLLRKRPDVRAVMVEKSYSMAMRIKESDSIPRRNFQTPQEISEHYTGMQDFCPLEEFLHAMQEIGIQKVDPGVSREIIDAYKAAIEKEDVFDPYGTIGSEDEWPFLGMSAADFATEEARKRLYLSPKVVSSFVVTEYFGLGVCVWHGNLYPGEFLIETREEFVQKDPALDEIIRRYFIDDDWRCIRKEK